MLVFVSLASASVSLHVSHANVFQLLLIALGNITFIRKSYTQMATLPDHLAHATVLCDAPEDVDAGFTNCLDGRYGSQMGRQPSCVFVDST